MSVRLGRSRLPPFMTAYRIASATIAGHPAARARHRARVRSAAKIVEIRRERHRVSALVVAFDQMGRVLQVTALGEELDAALGGAQLIVAVAGQRHAAFEQGERLVERQVAVFELLHDLLELGDGGFEIADRL